MVNKRNILVVSSEIIRNKYSASLTTFKFMEQASKYYRMDVLTEPMSTFDFDHLVNKLYLTNYKGHKGLIHYKLINKIYKYLRKHNVYRKLRLRAFKQSLKKLELSKYDYIFAFGGGDFFEPLEALSQHKVTKSVTIGYIHDPFPVHFFPKPYEESPTEQTLKHEKQLKKAFDNLDKLAFPSKLLGDWMGRCYKIPLEKRITIPHGIPLSLVANTASDKELKRFIEKYGLEEGFYFHAGTLLYHRRIEHIVEAFEKFKEETSNKKIKFLHIGNMQYDFKTNNEDIVIINKRLDLAFVNALAMKSLGLIIIEHIGEISPFLPGKFPEYISLNKPILHFGPKKSEIVRIFQEFYSDIDLKKFTSELDNIEGIYHVFLNGGLSLKKPELWDYFHFKPDYLVSN